MMKDVSRLILCLMLCALLFASLAILTPARTISTSAAATLTVTRAAAPLPTQKKRPKIEGGNAQPTGTPAANPRQPSPAPNRGGQRTTPRRNTRRSVPPPARPDADGALEVTIITEFQGTNVFLNGRPLDISGFDKRIQTKLTPQSYKLVTSRPGMMTRTYTIKVSPTQTTFNLVNIKPTNLASSSGAASTVNTPASAALTAMKPPPITPKPPPVDASVNPEEVMTRYLDPKLNSTITEPDWQKVEQVTTAALREAPENQNLKGYMLFAQGQLAFARKDYASAAVLFNNARLAVPTSAGVYYALGNNLLATNQPAQAIAAYNRATELNPQFALGYKGLGDAATLAGKTKDAFAYYDRARQLGLEDSALNLEVARNHIRSKRWRPALDALTPIVQAQPTAEIYLLMGDAYAGLQQPSSALGAYRRATEIDSQSAVGFYKFGEVMYDLREFAATVEAMERALALDTEGKDINRNRARNFSEKASKNLRKLRGK